MVIENKLDKKYIQHFITMMEDNHCYTIHQGSDIINALHLEDGIYIETDPKVQPLSSDWKKYLTDQIEMKEGPLYTFYIMYLDVLSVKYDEYINSDKRYQYALSSEDVENGVYTVTSIFIKDSTHRVAITTRHLEKNIHDITIDTYKHLESFIIDELSREIYKDGIIRSSPFKSQLQKQKFSIEHNMSNVYSRTVTMPYKGKSYELTFLEVPSNPLNSTSVGMLLAKLIVNSYNFNIELNLYPPTFVDMKGNIVKKPKCRLIQRIINIFK